MKKVSIVIPTYNEEANIIAAYTEITQILAQYKGIYGYEILYIDNHSLDASRELIKGLCEKDKNVKAIFNARNFGYMNNIYYGLINATGDCAILIHADLQNPPSVIPAFIREWEKGNKVVIGIKESSEENPIMFFIRACYYRLMNATSEVEQIIGFTDFELLDRDFLTVLQKLNDPVPWLRGIVMELGFKVSRVSFRQKKRERGKSAASLKLLYGMAMRAITSYSKMIMRAATILGFILSGICFVVALVTFALKLIRWDTFPIGTAAIIIGVFLLGSIQLFYIGLLGEYVLHMNTRIMNRPIVIEESRINF